MKKLFTILLISFFASTTDAQDYTYYSMGDTTDVSPSTEFGICLMGGATEDDNGSTWFLNKSGGGNIVVIRASGGDGYNDYFFNDLGVSVQSVETIVFNNANASTDPLIQRRLENAEAIWIAGGDQYIYETYWKNTPIGNILNNHVTIKEAPIGGTSAGMAILGEHYFSAEISSVTSATALSNPFDPGVSLETDFLSMPFLSNTITDTHYDNPDRKGRHTSFLARLTAENGETAMYGIAANEYVAICIDESGLAAVFGGYPAFPDAAYFIRMNCLNDQPEILETGTPLTWNTNNEALFVFKANATADGSSTFNLSDWTSASGGNWENWNVTNGILVESPSNQPECSAGISTLTNEVNIYPNPAHDIIYVGSNDFPIIAAQLTDNTGKVVYASTETTLFVNHLQTGIYTLQVVSTTGTQHYSIAIQR